MLAVSAALASYDHLRPYKLPWPCPAGFLIALSDWFCQYSVSIHNICMTIVMQLSKMVVIDCKRAALVSCEGRKDDYEPIVRARHKHRLGKD